MDVDVDADADVHTHHSIELQQKVKRGRLFGAFVHVKLVVLVMATPRRSGCPAPTSFVRPWPAKLSRRSKLAATNWSGQPPGPPRPSHCVGDRFVFEKPGCLSFPP